MKINIGLIGYGNIGKKIYNHLLEYKEIKNIYVLKKKKIKINPSIYTNEKEFFNKKFKYCFVATPINTHFKFLKKLINKNKNILVEKPIVNNFKELKEVKKIKKNYNVNYIDLYNPSFNLLAKDVKRVKKIEKINITIKKYQNIYKSNIDFKSISRLPFFDWLPHPLASIFALLNEKPKIVSINNKFSKRKNFIYQKLKLIFKIKNIKINLFFSNNSKKPVRNIKIFSKKEKFFYYSHKDYENISITKSKAIYKKYLNNKLIYEHKNKKENLFYVIDSVLKNKRNNFKSSFNYDLMQIIFQLGKKILIR